jgi:DNA-directed RNA polymerase specialized sigma24 family protein
LVALWSVVPKLDGERAPEAYLLTRARYAMLECLADERARLAQLARTPPDTDQDTADLFADPFANLPAPDPSPDHQLEDAERADRVREALAELHAHDPVTHAVVCAHAIDEVPIVHAGEPFGLGRGKTRGRYAAGARWLRRRLGGSVE